MLTKKEIFSLETDLKLFQLSFRWAVGLLSHKYSQERRIGGDIGKVVNGQETVIYFLPVYLHTDEMSLLLK